MPGGMTIGEGRLARACVSTADGRTFDLGRPGSLTFRFRRRLYLWRRRHEIKEAQHG